VAYRLIDCCPVPTTDGFDDEVELLLKESGGTLASAYRGTGVADLLAQCGKHDQTYLYNGYVNGLPGFNPANPPGHSTHELHSDGVAYPIPNGQRLPHGWMCGLDVDDAHVAAFCAAARTHDWVVTVTYPGDPREGHHVNFRQEAEMGPTFEPLEKGDSGDRVEKASEILAYVHVPGSDFDHTYMHEKKSTFDGGMESAVKDFQRDHKLDDDGVIGKHTMQQLHVSERQEHEHRQVRDLKRELQNVEQNLHHLREGRDEVQGKLDKARTTAGHDAEQKDLVKRKEEAEKAIDEAGTHAEGLRQRIREHGADPGVAPS
jgi:hypothetical protein